MYVCMYVHFRRIQVAHDYSNFVFRQDWTTKSTKSEGKFAVVVSTDSKGWGCREPQLNGDNGAQLLSHHGNCVL